MVEHYKILSVKESDLDMCLETIHEAFKISANRFGFTPENYPSCGAFLSYEKLLESKKNGVHMYAAWVNEKIVGYVQLEKKAKGVYSFQRFAVLPGYQKLGLGKALVSFCKNKAIIYGGKKINLLMIYENKSLFEFYKSVGFNFIEKGNDPNHPFEYAIMEMNL